MGTTWTDLSGNGNNGVLSGGINYSSANGGVMRFDGIDDYVNVPANTNLNNSAFSIEVWVNPTVARTQGIAHKYGSNGWRLFMSSTASTIEFDAQPGEIANIQTPAITLATWAHITATYDGTSSAKIYVNGVLKNTANGIASMFGDNNIGVEIASIEVNRWNGEIGKVNIYNRNLSDNEILQKFNNTKGQYGL